jgi:UDP:flavonoid glycosyltransferase YjiC (YdhE family)
MRVLFTTWAWPSHLYAMVPLAEALRAAGHDVRVASQPGLAPAVRAAGLPFCPVGRDVDAVSMFRDILTGGRTPGPPRVLSVFGAIAEAMADGLVDRLRRWPPELVVSDPTCWAGPLAAAVSGTPVWRLLYGLDLLSAFRDDVVSALGPLAGRLGVPGADPYAAPAISPVPPGLRGGEVDQAMRYVPYNGPGRPVSLSARPRICVTWGHTMARLGPRFFLAGPVLSALAHRTDVEIVVAVTPAQRRLLATPPPAVRVVDSVPLHQLLPHCQAVVAHGGAGTLLTALACGLPQVLVPQLPDHRAHAARLAATGSAIALAPDLTGLDAAVTAVLEDPAHQSAAGTLRAELLAQPSPAEVAEAISPSEGEKHARRSDGRCGAPADQEVPAGGPRLLGGPLLGPGRSRGPGGHR